MSNVEEPSGKTRGHVPPDGHDSSTGDAPKVPCETDLRPAYIQRLPDWIYQHPGYRRLNAGERRALDVIGWKCDDPKGHPGARGNLLGCFCRDDLAAFIGCGRRTLTSYIEKFEKLGFVRTLTRGGLIPGSTLANVIGIPAAPGALDTIAAPKGDRPTKYVREHIYKKLALVGNGGALSDDPALVGNGGADPAPYRREPGAATALTQRRNGALPSSLSHSSRPSPSPSSSTTPDDNQGHDGDENPELRQVLAAIGVEGPNLKRLARGPIDWLDPLLLVASDSAQVVKDLPAYVVRRLTDHRPGEDLIKDRYAAEARLYRSKIIKPHQGRWCLDLTALRTADLAGLSEIDGTLNEASRAQRILLLDEGSPIEQLNAIAGLFGGGPDDYLPFARRGPLWKFMPALQRAKREGHPSPLEYAAEAFGVSLIPNDDGEYEHEPADQAEPADAIPY